ncbi:MAG: TPM domain-containing protein, partial [Giesbergeria sp.]
MRFSLVRYCFLAIVLIAIGSQHALSQSLLPVPELAAHVIDETGTLDAAQRSAMEARLAELEQREGTQLVVLMVQTTAPEDIAAFANRVGNVWKIGRQGVGDGLLIVVAKNDRKMRIEVAKALEGAIPDIAAARIIDQAMKPRFRENDFAGGLNAAVDQLAARIAGEPLPEPTQEKPAFNFKSNWLNVIGVGFFVALGLGHLLRAIFGKRVGSLLLGGGAGV